MCRVRYTFTKQVLVAAFIALCAVPAQGSPQQEAAAEDSTSSYPGRLPSRSTLETALWLPGAIVHLPVHLAFQGFAWGVGWVDDTMIMQRVQDYLTTDDTTRGLQLTYSERTGGGVNLYQRFAPAGRFVAADTATYAEAMLTATGLSEDRYLAQLQWSNFALGSLDLFLAGYARARRFDGESFYGLGPASSPDGEALYAHELYRATVQLRRMAGAKTGFALGGGYEHNDIDTSGEVEEGEIPALQTTHSELTAPGSSSGAALGWVSLSAFRDTRNRPGNPSYGGETHVRAGLYGDVEGDRWGFVRLRFDHFQYFHIAYERILAVRLLAESVRTLDDGEVPFFRMAQLGSNELLRGYPRNRFHGTGLLMGTLEYRFPLRDIWDESGVDFVLFVDAGQVTMEEDFHDLHIPQVQAGFGGGVRIWNLKGVVARIELARSHEMWRLYFVLN